MGPMIRTRDRPARRHLSRHWGRQWRTTPPGGDRRRRIRRTAGHPVPRWETGRGDTGRPAQSPPLPAAPLPDRHRHALPGTDRPGATPCGATGEERTGPAGRGHRLRSRPPGGPRHRGRAPGHRVPLRHPHRGGRGHPVVFRARRIRVLRPGDEDPGRRARAAAAHLRRLRGGRNDLRSNRKAALADLRGCRRRTHRGRIGRSGPRSWPCAACEGSSGLSMPRRSG